MPCSPFNTIDILSFLVGLAFYWVWIHGWRYLLLGFSSISLPFPAFLPDWKTKKQKNNEVIRSSFCSWRVFYIFLRLSPILSLLVTKLGWKFVNIFYILVFDRTQPLEQNAVKKYFQYLKTFVFSLLSFQGYHFPKLWQEVYLSLHQAGALRDQRPSEALKPTMNYLPLPELSFLLHPMEDIWWLMVYLWWY